MENIMKKQRKFLWTALLLFMVSIFAMGCVTVSAATKTGFVTIGGKTYYIKEDGTKQKGWLQLNGKKYYFNKSTGVQVKGWVKDSSGKTIRYFTKGTGCMVTGFVSDSKGNTRYFDKKTGLLTRGWMENAKGEKYYFYSGSGIMAKGWVENKKGQKRYFSQATGKMCVSWVKNSKGYYRYFKPSTGIMYTGLRKVGKYYYYFSKTTGIRYQKGFGTVGKNKYYFDPDTGRMKTGWLTYTGNKYYFKSNGVMMVNTVTAINGTSYKFDSNGVASKLDYSYKIEGNYVKVYDSRNAKYYYMEKEFLEHPGVAEGKVSDLELLAAVCDAEAGNQGLVGMEAVALCILNSTIDKYKDFPSQIRYLIYQGKPTQYAVVTNGALLKRLKGTGWESKTVAHQAAEKAMKIFDDYVNTGKKRVLRGFTTKDFKYKYFMTPAAFWSQNLNFSKLNYEIYKGHVFFEDWISG